MEMIVGYGIPEKSQILLCVWKIVKSTIKKNKLASKLFKEKVSYAKI